MEKDHYENKPRNELEQNQPAPRKAQIPSSAKHSATETNDHKQHLRTTKHSTPKYICEGYQVCARHPERLNDARVVPRRGAKVPNCVCPWRKDLKRKTVKTDSSLYSVVVGMTRRAYIMNWPSSQRPEQYSGNNTGRRFCSSSINWKRYQRNYIHLCNE